MTMQRSGRAIKPAEHSLQVQNIEMQLLKVLFVLSSVSVISVNSGVGTCGAICRSNGFGPCRDDSRLCRSCCSSTCTGRSDLRCNDYGEIQITSFRRVAIISSYASTQLSNGGGLRIRTPYSEEENITNGSSLVDEAAYGYCKFCEQVSFEVKISEPDAIAVVGDEIIDPCRANSTGLLCSRCENGFNHNRKGECVSAENGSCSNLALQWFLFILIEIIPSTLFFLFLYATEFSLVDGGLNSAIFFAQMITTTMDITSDGFIPISNMTDSPQTSESLIGAYHFIYGFWNLEFFSPFSQKLCLFRAESYLIYFLTEYIIAIYPIVLLCVVLAVRTALVKVECLQRLTCLCRLGWCSKTRKFLNLYSDWEEANHNLKVSVLVLSYSKLAITSAALISGVYLYDSNGDAVRLVSLFDASTNYTSLPYIVFAIVGWIILFLLFMYPILILLVTYLRDIKNYHKFSCFDKLVSLFRKKAGRVQTDDDAVSSGLDKIFRHFHDHRWIETAYFILRVALLIAYVMPLSLIQKYIVEQGIILVGMMCIIFLYPYEKEKWLSRVDMFMLLLLVFINTLSMYQYSLTQSSMHLSLATFVVQYIFIFIPFLWMTGFISAKFICWCRKLYTTKIRGEPCPGKNGAAERVELSRSGAEPDDDTARDKKSYNSFPAKP